MLILLHFKFYFELHDRYAGTRPITKNGQVVYVYQIKIRYRASMEALERYYPNR